MQVDRLFDWAAHKDAPIQHSFAEQKPHVQTEFRQRYNESKLNLNEQVGPHAARLPHQRISGLSCGSFCKPSSANGVQLGPSSGWCFSPAWGNKEGFLIPPGPADQLMPV